MQNFKVKIYHEASILDKWNDNADVEVLMGNGDRYSATFFTIQNIQSLFQKNRDSKEYSNGTYFWSSDMIIVEKLDRGVVTQTILDLIKEGLLEQVMSKLD